MIGEGGGAEDFVTVEVPEVVESTLASTRRFYIGRVDGGIELISLNQIRIVVKLAVIIIAW